MPPRASRRGAPAVRGARRSVAMRIESSSASHPPSSPPKPVRPATPELDDRGNDSDSSGDDLDFFDRSKRLPKKKDAASSKLMLAAHKKRRISDSDAEESPAGAPRERLDHDFGGRGRGIPNSSNNAFLEKRNSFKIRDIDDSSSDGSESDMDDGKQPRSLARKATGTEPFAISDSDEEVTVSDMPSKQILEDLAKDISMKPTNVPIEPNVDLTYDSSFSVSDDDDETLDPALREAAQRAKQRVMTAAGTNSTADGEKVVLVVVKPWEKETVPAGPATSGTGRKTKDSKFKIKVSQRVDLLAQQFAHAKGLDPADIVLATRSGVKALGSLTMGSLLEKSQASVYLTAFTQTQYMEFQSLDAARTARLLSGSISRDLTPEPDVEESQGETLRVTVKGREDVHGWQAKVLTTATVGRFVERYCKALNVAEDAVPRVHLLLDGERLDPSWTFQRLAKEAGNDEDDDELTLEAHGL